MRIRNLIPWLEWSLYWLLVALPVCIAIAPAMTYICMTLLFVAFTAKKAITREQFIPITVVTVPFLALSMVSFISFRNTIDYHASVRGMTKLLEYFFLFSICAEEIKDRKHLTRIIGALICGAVLASSDALWQVVLGKDFIRGNELILNIGLKRATAAFPNANVLGVYLSALAPLVVGMTLYGVRGKRRVAMLIMSLLVIGGIVVTFSRGTALAFYAAILMIAMVRRDKRTVSLLIILLFLFPFILPRPIKDWAKSVHYDPAVFMLNADRLSIYRNTFNMIQHHPFVGVGVNTFSENYPRYKLFEPQGAETGTHMYAHNHFLHMAGEIGLIGLGTFLWLLYALFRNQVRLYRGLRDERLRVVSLGLSACVLAFLVNGLTETSLYYSRVAMIFWYLIGIALALEKTAPDRHT